MTYRGVNAARYADEHDAELWCGYALGNDMWRPHSWCVDGERIIETTVEADAYYGAIDPAT